MLNYRALSRLIAVVFPEEHDKFFYFIKFDLINLHAKLTHLFALTYCFFRIFIRIASCWNKRKKNPAFFLHEIKRKISHRLTASVFKNIGQRTKWLIFNGLRKFSYIYKDWKYQQQKKKERKKKDQGLHSMLHTIMYIVILCYPFTATSPRKSELCFSFLKLKLRGLDGRDHFYTIIISFKRRVL